MYKGPTYRAPPREDLIGGATIPGPTSLDVYAMADAMLPASRAMLIKYRSDAIKTLDALTDMYLHILVGAIYVGR